MEVYKVPSSCSRRLRRKKIVDRKRKYEMSPTDYEQKFFARILNSSEIEMCFCVSMTL